MPEDITEVFQSVKGSGTLFTNSVDIVTICEQNQVMARTARLDAPSVLRLIVVSLIGSSMRCVGIRALDYVLKN